MACDSAVEKSELLPLATACRDLASTMLSEISELERDQRHMISCMCVGSKEQSKWTNRTEPDSEMQRTDGWAAGRMKK